MLDFAQSLLAVFSIFFKPLVQEVILLSSAVDPVQLLAFHGPLRRKRENTLDCNFFPFPKELWLLSDSKGTVGSKDCQLSLRGKEEEQWSLLFKVIGQNCNEVLHFIVTIPESI